MAWNWWILMCGIILNPDLQLKSIFDNRMDGAKTPLLSDSALQLLIKL